MLSFGEIRRRKMFQVIAVYAVVAWLIVEIITTIKEPLGLPQWSDTLVIVLLALGFPIMLMVSWLFNVTADGLVRDAGTAKRMPRAGPRMEWILLGIIAIAVAWLFYRTEFDPSTSPDDSSDAVAAAESLAHSVAVLPFENLSPNLDDAYFATGLHEEILNRLAKLRNIRVISRTSVQQYSGTKLTIPEIAEELNVGAIMEGSVQYADGRVRIHAQLIDAATDEHIWTETYEEAFESIFAIQSNIASNIANALQAEFSLAEQESLTLSPTTSVDAYRAYLGVPPPAGQPGQLGEPPPPGQPDEFGRPPHSGGPPQPGGPGETARLDNLRRAIDADPEFAAAYIERAGIYIQALRTPGAAASLLDAETDLERLALDDIEKALEIDPKLGRAYAWLGMIHRYNWRGAASRDAFETALELSPNDPNVLTNYGYFLSNIGSYDEAIEIAQRAAQFDPRNPETRAALAQFYAAAGRYNEAAMALHDVGPGQAPWVLPLAANYEIILGNQSNAETLLRHSERFAMTTESPQWPALVAYNYARLDLADDAARLLARYAVLADQQRVPAAAEILVHLARGDETNALRRLHEAAEEKTPYEAFNLLMGIVTNVYRDPILDKPEFATARRKLRFPDL